MFIKMFVRVQTAEVSRREPLAGLVQGVIVLEKIGTKCQGHERSDMAIIYENNLGGVPLDSWVEIFLWRWWGEKWERFFLPSGVCNTHMRTFVEKCQGLTTMLCRNVLLFTVENDQALSSTQQQWRDE